MELVFYKYHGLGSDGILVAATTHDSENAKSYIYDF